jgi:hypothetical protein
VHKSALEDLGYARFEDLKNDVLARKQHMIASFYKFQTIIEDMCSTENKPGQGFTRAHRDVLRNARLNVDIVNSKFDQDLRHRTQREVFGRNHVVEELEIQLQTQKAEANPVPSGEPAPQSA